MSVQQQPLNDLIWISVKPVLKLSGPALAGYLLTRANLLPPAGSRSVSQIILNVTLPALLFSKIILSFNNDNVGAIGVIVLTSLFYMAISLVFGVLIRVFLPVPRNFRYGIIAAAGWSNTGDLPTSVVATITLSAPFSGVVDSNLAIAYVAIFILVFYITMFPFQGCQLISRDYSHLFKESEDEESTPTFTPQSTTEWWRTKGNSIRMYPTVVQEEDAKEKMLMEKKDQDSNYIDSLNQLEKVTRTRSRSKSSASVSGSQRPPFADFLPLDRVITNKSIGAASTRELAGAQVGATFEDTSERRRGVTDGKRKQNDFERMRTIVGSRANSVFESRAPSPIQTVKTISNLEEVLSRTVSLSPTRQFLNATLQFLASLATPPTIALTLALIFALVKNLKSLFVYDPTSSFDPTAPDNAPPLSIILDTASFIGAASVPLGLMVLGSALARMRLPRPLSRLPISSILGLAVAKLVILPIIAYFFVEALVAHTNLVDAENKVLRFTLIYFSALPTATTQVTLTQIYAPLDGEDNSDVLASYLIVQYIIFVFSSVILTAVVIRTIF